MVAEFLDQTCNVERQTAIAGTTGANVPTWSARLSNVACTLQPYRHSREIFEFQRDQSLTYYIMYTVTDLQATTQDRINVGGTIYTVIGYKYYINSTFWPEPYGATLVAIRGG